MGRQEQEKEHVLKRSSKNIFTDSDNPSLQSLGKEEIVKAVYEKDKIFVGWNLGDHKDLEKIIEDLQSKYSLEFNEARKKALRLFKDSVGSKREEVFLDRSTADLLFLGGKPGSGKTALTRAITNRNSKAGGKNLIVDPSHEYYSNNLYHGIQKSLEKLRPNENPQKIKTNVIMPKWVKHRREENNLKEKGYEYTDFFQLSFEDLSPSDLAFLLKDKLTEGIQADFDIFISELSTALETEGEDFTSWDDITGFAHRLQEEEKFQWTRRADVIENFVKSNYKGKDFFGGSGNLDYSKVFEDVNTVVLSLQTGGEKYDHLRIFELYTAIVCRKVYQQRLKGVINPPLTFSGDEAHLLAPKKTDVSRHPAKSFFRKAAKQGRKHGIRLNFASQEPGDVQDKNFLSLGRHFFIPHNMSDSVNSKPRKHLLELGDVWSSGDKQSGKWQKIFDGMNRLSGRYPWLYCFSGGWMVLEPASPLANHLQEEK